MWFWGRIWLVLIFALLSVRGSVCWSPSLVEQHYLDAASRGNISQHIGLHYQALALNLPVARFNHYYQSVDWSINQKITWLSHASLNRDWRAHWYIGRLWHQEQQLPRAKLWYVSAKELYQHNTENLESESFSRLLIELSQIYIELMQFEQAIALLNSKSLTHELIPTQLRLEVKYKAALIKLYQGDVIGAESILTQIVEQYGVDAPNMVKQKKSEVEQLLTRYPSNIDFSQANCLVKVQLLVSDYQQWRFAHQILTKWQKHASLTQLPVCFEQIRAFDPKIIHCIDQVGVRQSCDLTLMANHLKLPEDILPVVMNGRAGIANYNNGVVFVNRGGSFEIFVHELFHHFGFIDEYRVSSQVAQKLCSVSKPTFRGENLLVVPKSQVSTVIQLERYAKVDTCNGTDSKAFKPIQQLTMMQFMDQKIPQLYIDKAITRLKERPERVANYQYAYALAFYNDNLESDYQYWLSKSAQKGYYAAKMLFGK